MSAVARRVTGAFGVILVVAALVGFAVLVVDDTRAAGGELSEARREYNRLQCIGELSLGLVPDDSVVFVARHEGSRAAYWNQRLIELTAPERWVTHDPDQADVILGLVRSESGPCDGYDLEVSLP
jgi:hypothetical protein